MMNTDTQQSQYDAMVAVEGLRGDYLLQAQWTLGGAFRFDASLQKVLSILKQLGKLFPITHVAGSMPCSASLDWFVQRRPVAMVDYINALETYAQMGLGVVLVLDNPAVNPETAADPYVETLIQELYNRDRVRMNAVCVASDALAEHIRGICPRLPIHCHLNRLVMENGKRTAQLYNKLGERYARVCLHPGDAVKPAIYGALNEPQKYDAVMNDPCLRTCPVRREHVRLLSQMRRAPYDTTLMVQRSNLIDRTACQKLNPAELQQKATCNLTRSEAQSLHDAGIRRFIIQSQQFRNEMTLLWDIFRCLQNDDPAISNKAALIASATMAEFGKPTYTLPSGLRGFSFSNYE